MKDIHLEVMIALMNKRAQDATRSPRDALRHLISAGIFSPDGTLAPEYAANEDTGTAVTSASLLSDNIAFK